jgi:hypothetical protein
LIISRNSLYYYLPLEQGMYINTSLFTRKIKIRGILEICIESYSVFGY